MRTSEIGAFLGHTNRASTRRWISDYKLTARGRDTETGEKLYLRDDVLQAKAGMPGKGARTDLTGSRPPAEGQHDDDGDAAT